ncbi:CatB-related O-acetyltransferase [Sulfitobacter donghicola]|uniref:Acetyltransferase n=1 Tax=Sulfitobacter donghicola DSW-25 = KCTC 12864 = JCM 14565 TaxID=1300350 RepID=A0A073IBS5_9RHOB|nr:CatB-related O-acetyltransferase [Sulfitobacter donghicola]KEJ87778.1 hypothetical protein DSW25_05140 [Sulfitobacter donghicola DSW-25 = KCTC 12864 = JCM 14565]KIN70404.1 Transferase hexapeptide repeat containing protein [Sulfitobacter donghicola DSW-25 = KCTC 12864 = JCM 14565]
MPPVRAPKVIKCSGNFTLFAEDETTVALSELGGAAWLGFGSYVGAGSAIRSYVEIGRYCSIGRDVSVGLGNHDLTATSTSPWFPVRNDLEMPLAQKEPARRVLIGHDVWIGDGAKIVSGVTIGTGAMIATSAVVTKDVAPYEVVGGHPCQDHQETLACQDHQGGTEKRMVGI